MLNEKQKTEYLNLLMDYEKNPRWIEDFYKYKNSLLPQKLYRYRTVNKYNLEALKRNYLWLTSPDKFNDMYDCKLNINSKLLFLHDILNVDWYKDNPFDEKELLLFLNIQNKIKTGDMTLKEFINFLKSNIDSNINNKLISSPAFVSYKDVYDCFRDQDISPASLMKKNINCNVACFSETNDNILMWAHYANCNKGFCIEYETKQLKDLINKIYPILYMKKPIFCPKLMNDYRENKIDVSLLQTIFSTTKFADWQYEKEWRIFSGKQKLQLSSLPSCIYLGKNIKKYDEAKLCKVADKLKIKVRKMEFIEGQYKLKAIDC